MENKYWAKKVEYKGIRFDSTVERDRYLYLKEMQRIGKIESLRLQVEFTVIPRLTKTVAVQLKTKVKYKEKSVEREARYTCDFIYKENGVYIIEDVKSEYGRKASRDYPLRRSLMNHKISAHNAKGRSQWMFREAVLVGKRLVFKEYS